jgi:hypothetical protein
MHSSPVGGRARRAGGWVCWGWGLRALGLCLACCLSARFRSLPLAAFWARGMAQARKTPGASRGIGGGLSPGLRPGFSFGIPFGSFMHCEWARAWAGAAGPLASARGLLGAYGMASPREAPGGNRGIGWGLSPGLRPGFPFGIPFGSFMHCEWARAWVGAAFPLASARGLLGAWYGFGTENPRWEPGDRPASWRRHGPVTRRR